MSKLKFKEFMVFFAGMEDDKAIIEDELATLVGEDGYIQGMNEFYVPVQEGIALVPYSEVLDHHCYVNANVLDVEGIRLLKDSAEADIALVKYQQVIDFVKKHI